MLGQISLHTANYNDINRYYYNNSFIVKFINDDIIIKDSEI
jgi:hypothetical protein